MGSFENAVELTIYEHICVTSDYTSVNLCLVVIEHIEHLWKGRDKSLSCLKT